MSTSCGASASDTAFGEPTLAPTAASIGAATLPLAATAPSIGAARLASAWMLTLASSRLPPLSNDSTPPAVLPTASVAPDAALPTASVTPGTAPDTAPVAPSTAPVAPDVAPSTAPVAPETAPPVAPSTAPVTPDTAPDTGSVPPEAGADVSPEAGTAVPDAPSAGVGTCVAPEAASAGAPEAASVPPAAGMPVVAPPTPPVPPFEVWSTDACCGALAMALPLMPWSIEPCWSAYPTASAPGLSTLAAAEASIGAATFRLAAAAR